MSRLPSLALPLMIVLAAPAAAQRLDERAAASLVTVHRWPDGATLRAASADTALARTLVPMFDAARERVAQFFGAPFREPVAITLVPDRAAFSDALRRTWGVPDTQCWMVAAGVADFVIGISPRAWGTDACEHPADSAHVREIFTHELAHAYHGQHHPSRDFDFPAADSIAWFAEGLAVLVAGQLDGGRMAGAAEAIRAGAAPTELEHAWSGRYRYGVSGSLVRYIDQRWGRATITRLMGLSSEAAILAALGVSEAELLAGWRASVAR